MHAKEAREESCYRLVRGIETACARWAAFRFPGALGRLPFEERPIGRTFGLGGFSWTENEKIPEALGIWHFSDTRSHEVWTTGERLNWSISTSGLRNRINTITAFRSIDTSDGKVADPHLRSLLHGFSESFDDFMARWGLVQTLSLYRAELVKMRDGTASARAAVDSAKTLSDYISRHGTDTVTVATDVVDGPDLIVLFEMEQRLLAKGNDPTVDAPQLLSTTQQLLRSNAKQVLMEYGATTSAVTAYSQLALAAENAKLQQKLFRYTVAAIIVAVLSLGASSCQLLAHENHPSAPTRAQQSN
jgi:hypothetical protein